MVAAVRTGRATALDDARLPTLDLFHPAFEDADLVPPHQPLGLISAPFAEGSEVEVDEESEAGVKNEEQQGRRLIQLV